MTWLEDTNGNRCSVEHFGSKEAAQTALDSLKNCRNCTNCTNCSNCSRCSNCSEAAECFECFGCTRSFGCTNCSRCAECSECSDCSNVAFVYVKKDLKGDPESTWSGPPPIPKIQGIHAKIYAAVSQPDALEMKTWHTCETTHCRGGWAVALAGKPGRALEAFHGTLLAAQLIYRESGYPLNPCRFFDSNEDAMADMKRLADGA